MIASGRIEKSKCCGCTACANACPVQCIDMKPDFEGFLYPVINQNTCIGCNLCREVCPIDTPPFAGEYERKSFAIRAKNMDVVMNSTSGGFFTPLADWVLDQNGVICAASFDDDFSIVHKIMGMSDKSSEKVAFERYRGSKYVQSDLGDCFSKIKLFLEEGKLACFIGTPCQVNGLKSFLKVEYDKLLTVDLVCFGVPSPKLWEKYKDYQIKKHNSSIEYVAFRNKTYGYHSGTMKIQFKNGKTYYGSGRVDYMLKSFLKNISSRPSCYQCSFKQLKRCSDLTIYDCWHISELVPEVKDDNRGYTNLIVHSEKGMEFFEQIKERFEVYLIDTEKAVQLDGIMIEHTAIPHPNRDEYYIELDSEDLQSHVQRFIPISFKDKAIERMKSILYRLRILELIKKIIKN